MNLIFSSSCLLGINKVGKTCIILSMKHHRRILSSLCLLGLSLGISQPVAAASPPLIGPGANHPERHWQIFETEHFQVHYYQGFEEFSRYAVDIAEKNFAHLSQDLGVKLKQKIPLVITEDEFWNGYAEPLRTRIVLDPRFSLEPTIGLPRFMLHELTHILNFLAVDNGMVFGRLTKAAGLPAWFAEGLAQYEAEYWAPEMDRLLRLHALNHSLLTPAERNAFILLGQRGADGYNEGYALVKYFFDTYGHDKVKKLLGIYRDQSISFDQAIQLTFGKSMLQLEAEWRDGLELRYRDQVQDRQAGISHAKSLIPYRAGKSWYLPKMSPDGKWMAYLSSNGYPTIRGQLYSILPLHIASTADLKQYGDYLRYSDDKSAKQKNKDSDLESPVLDQKPAPEPTPLSETPVSSRLADDGQQTTEPGTPIPKPLPKSSPNPAPEPAPDLNKPAEVKLDKIEEEIAERALEIAWKPDSKALAYTTIQAGPKGTAEYRVLIQKLKLDQGHLKADGDAIAVADQVMHSPQWSPDGQSLYLVLEDMQRDHLIRYDLASQQATRLLSAPDLRQYNQLALSPDGQLLAFETYLPGQPQSLMMLNLANGQTKQISMPPQRSNDRQVIWGPDNQSLYFVSTRTGFADLYRYQIDSAQIERLSQTYTGFDTPSLSADSQSLLYAQHHVKGLSLESIALDQLKPLETLTPIKQPAIFESNQSLTPPPELTFKSSDYIPWMGLEVVVPVVGRDEKGDQLGALVQFSDLLQQHAFNILFLHGIASSRIGFSTAYVNRFFDTSFGIEVGDTPALSFTTDGSQFFIQRDQHISLFANRPLFNEGTGDTSATRIERFASLEFNAAYQTNLTSQLNGQIDSQQLREGFNNTLSFSFNDNRSRGKRTGFAYSLGVSGASRLWGSQYEYVAGTAEWRQYIPTWAEHTLAYHITGLALTGETRPGLLGGPPLSNLLVLNFQNIVPLRGFRIAELQGPLMVAGSLEYRVPIFKPILLNWGAHYVENLNAAAFIDIGDAWYPSKRSGFPHVGAGIEFRSDLILNQRNSFQLYLGAGKAIMSSSDTQQVFDVFQSRPIEFYGGFANVF